MDFKIIEKEAFNISGTSIDVSTKDNENKQAIPQFWIQVNTDGTSEKIFKLSSDQSLLGVCMMPDLESETFTYAIAAVTNDQTEIPAEFKSWAIEANTWAVFVSIGPMPDAIQTLWQKIYNEWFPSSGFKHSKGPELEVYPPGNPGAEDYRCEVWIPIEKN